MPYFELFWSCLLERQSFTLKNLRIKYTKYQVGKCNFDIFLH